MQKYKLIILYAIILLAVSFLIFLYLRPSATKPWEETSKFTLAVRAVPYINKTDTTLGFGIDNVELYKKDGTIKSITILTRRVMIDPNKNNLMLVLETDAPTGSYSGLSFTMKSPEMKNPWQQDTPPEHVSLISDNIRLDSPFEIKKDKDSAVILAFETMQAIHKKEDKNIYLPVIQIETRSGVNTNVENKNSIIIQDGKIENSATFGMSWNGKMRYNFREHN